MESFGELVSPNTRYTMEIEENDKMLSLDLSFTISKNRLSTTIYQKSAPTGQYFNGESNHWEHV